MCYLDFFTDAYFLAHLQNCDFFKLIMFYTIFGLQLYFEFKNGLFLSYE